MTKTTCLLLLLNVFCFSASSFGQNDIKNIEFDFATKIFTTQFPQKIKKGKFYKINIQNINMNLFNVSIDKKDSIIVSDVQFPTLDLLGLDGINKVITSIVATTKSSSPIQSIQNELSKKELDKAALYIQKMNLQSNIESYNSFSSKLKNDQKSLIIEKGIYDSLSNDMQKKISDAREKINMIEGKIFNLEKEIQVQKYLLEEEIKKSKPEEIEKQIIDKINITKESTTTQLNIAKKHIEQANDLIGNLNLQSLIYIQSFTTNTHSSILDVKDSMSIKQMVEETNKIREAIKKEKTEIEKIEKEYLDFKKTNDAKYSDTAKKLHQELINTISQAKTTIDTEADKISKSKIAEFIASIIHLNNNSNRTYSTLPLQHNGDISSITLHITPKKPEFGPSYSAVYKFPHSKNYVGIGGAFYHVTGKSFRNDVYSVQEFATSDTTSQFSIVNEDPEGKDKEIGFATLLHVGTKLSQDLLGIHFTIGPAISLTAKPQVRLAMGGGVSIGKNKNMVSIDLLGIAGNVQRKSNLYSETQTYDKFPEQITVSKLKAAFAIAVGYIYKF